MKHPKSSLRTKAGRELDEMIMSQIDGRIQSRYFLDAHPPSSVTLEMKERKRLEREMEELRVMRRLLYMTEREAMDEGRRRYIEERDHAKRTKEAL